MTLAFEGISVTLYVLEYMRATNLDYKTLEAKTIIEMAVLINLIDIAFWFFGFISLRYENGDTIREELVNYGKRSEYDESEPDYHNKNLNSF